MMEEEAELERRRIEEDARKFFAFTGATKVPANAIFILVMGMTGAGKSSFVSACTGQSVIVGHGLQSCTSDISIFDFDLDGKRVYLIDTPGFNDTNRSDTETLRVIATYLSESYLRNVNIHGIVYLHRIMDNRMTGSSKRNIDMFKALCGYTTYDNVAIATTFWNSQDQQTFVQREAELESNPEFFGGVVSEGATMFRHCDSGQSPRHLKHSARSIVRALIAKSHSPVTLLIQHELVDERKTLLQTSAGIVLAGDLQKVVQDYNRQLASLQREMGKTIHRSRESHAEDLQEVKNEYEQKLQSLKREQRSLAATLEQMRAEEKEALLKKLKATERRYAQQLKRRKEELLEMKESLELMSQEVAQQRSAVRREALRQELFEQESRVTKMEKNVGNGQQAYNNLKGTTKSLTDGIISGVAGSVATAVLTGGLLCIVQ